MFTLAPAKLKYKYNICVTDEIGQAALNIHLEINIHLSNWKLYCPLFSTHNRKKPFVKLNVKRECIKKFLFPTNSKVFRIYKNSPTPIFTFRICNAISLYMWKCTLVQSVHLLEAVYIRPCLPRI